VEAARSLAAIEADRPSRYRTTDHAGVLNMRARLALAACLAFTGSSAFSETGQDVFNDKCGDCHSLDPSPVATAPPLKGVVGRKIASIAGFEYSDALKSKSGVWTEANLDVFLANPQSFAPGTTMFGGAPDPADRKAIIGYLKAAK
jgi:cytochrome c